MNLITRIKGLCLLRLENVSGNMANVAVLPVPQVDPLHIARIQFEPDDWIIPAALGTDGCIPLIQNTEIVLPQQVASSTDILQADEVPRLKRVMNPPGTIHNHNLKISSDQAMVRLRAGELRAEEIAKDLEGNELDWQIGRVSQKVAHRVRHVAKDAPTTVSVSVNETEHVLRLKSGRPDNIHVCIFNLPVATMGGDPKKIHHFDAYYEMIQIPASRPIPSAGQEADVPGDEPRCYWTAAAIGPRTIRNSLCPPAAYEG